MMLRKSVPAGVAIGIGLACVCAGTPVTLTLKDHHLAPDHLDVPAGQRFRIEIVNQDATAGEFESSDMKFEKIMAAGDKISVYAGPLHPGGCPALC